MNRPSVAGTSASRTSSPTTLTRGFRALPAALAMVFLIAHLPVLPSTLDDIDSMNFALGVRVFDPVRHQPHPPGYPLYIALGKLSAIAMRNEAMRLAIWSAIFGAIALIPIGYFFRALDALDDRPDARGRPLMATIVAVCCPLFWLMAVRPVSDLPGLCAALVAQALLATACLAQRHPENPRATPKTRAASGRLIVLGALAAGVSIGFRSQAAWITLPLLALVLLDRTGRGAAGAWLGSAMSFTLGMAVWAIPLVIASGGLERYGSAVIEQAHEDLTGVDMLATYPTARGLAFALLDTFVRPWGAAPLAAVVLTLGAVGLVAMTMRSRKGIVLLAAAWLPYALFHLWFQETVTVRDALPPMVPLAYLAVRGAAVAGRRAMIAVASVISIASLIVVAPVVKIYAASPSPIVRALTDYEREVRRDSVLAMHQVFARAVLLEDGRTGTMLPAAPRHEWLELVKYFSAGGAGPVTFLADPRRTDLALLDHAARRVVATYRWPDEVSTLMHGTRPWGVDVQRIVRPGWLLGRGWSLTPETAGTASIDAPDAGEPVVGFVRRTEASLVLMIGGRHLGAAGEPDARFQIALDGRPLDGWTVNAGGSFFFRMSTLPAGTFSGPGLYANLAVSAAAADGSGRVVQTAIEQFDLQPVDQIVFGFDRGWYELEYAPSAGRLWRWSSDRATVLVHNIGRTLTMRMTGESPLESFARPSQVVVRTGDRELARETVAADFELTVPIPADALAAGHDRVTIETDQSFVPAERSASGDHRRLGLKIYTVEIR